MNNISLQKENIGSMIIFCVFGIGLFLSVYHAFTNREKTNTEKKLMVIFAAFINGFSGIWSGAYMLTHSNVTALTIFPIWDIISGYILLGFLRAPEIEKSISDENVSIGQVLKGSIATSIIFYICYSVYSLNWAVTFSKCVTWATNLNRPFDSLLLRERMKI